MSLNRVAYPSPNYSSRGGATVRLIVLHTAEGARTIESLGSFFGSSSSGVSSHVGIDDKAGTIGVYVKRTDKAWTQADANPWAVSAELCAFAAWDLAEWHRHPAMLENCAAWIAEEAAAFALPIKRLTPDQARSGAAGVCQHVDLGSWGGSHHDCGPAFPMDEVIAMAGGLPSSSPPPSPSGSPSGPGSSAAPPWPGRYLSYPPLMQGTDVQTWQAQMAARGWTLAVDAQYGPESKQACYSFQVEKALTADGVVGPETWAATWTAPVT